MNLIKRHIALVLLAVSLVLSGNLRAADDSKRIRVDGDRLSVHAEGMGLGDLLSAVGDMTGIRFKFDKSVTDKKVYVDFEGLPLSRGIKKIIHPLNFATIYDDAGKLSKVIILERWMDSPLNVPLEEGDDSPKPTPSNRVPSTPKGNRESPAASKEPPLGKQGSHFHGFSASETPSADGPTDSQEQAVEGPPVGRAYSMTGPPNTQNQTQEGPPDAGTSGLPTTRDSKDSGMDGPPDRGDGPMEGPPGARDSQK